MNREAAEQAVTVSAMVVGGIYGWRRLTYTGTTNADSAKAIARNLVGGGPPPPFGHWAIAYGVAFLFLSALATVAPAAGGSLAVTVALATIFDQGLPLFGELGAQERSGLAPGATADTPSPGSPDILPGLGGRGVQLAPAAAPSPATFRGQLTASELPYHPASGGVSFVPLPSHGNTAGVGVKSLAQQAADQGLHYDPASGQYVP